jgi:EAL domain-containing protein (putative c-di-GMP-specific phosphodiesterase class I)
MNVMNSDAVKMSKELFWDLHENDTISLKHMLKMIKRKANIIVIKGVERVEKYIFCKEQQCLMQGYFLMKSKIVVYSCVTTTKITLS